MPDADRQVVCNVLADRFPGARICDRLNIDCSPKLLGGHAGDVQHGIQQPTVVELDRVRPDAQVIQDLRRHLEDTKAY